jgi:cell division protein DivIC
VEVIGLKSKSIRVLLRNRYWIAALMSVILMSTFVLVQQEMKMAQMAYEKSLVVEQVKGMQQEVKSLVKEVEALDSDEAKEAMARQKLNMIKLDEILYIVKTQKSQ